MRTINFLFLVIVILITYSSCTKENSFFITDGLDGEDGYSTSMFYDEVANMTVYYWNRDTIPGYTSGDTIIFRENNTGLKFKTNLTGCLEIYYVSGLTETLIKTLCDGINGTNGTDGQNGHSNVFRSRPMTNGEETVGNYLDIFRDEDDNGFLTEPDVLMITVSISNGKTVIPEFRVTSVKITNGIIYTIYVNDMLFTTDTIFNGETGDTGATGPAGMAPSLKATDIPIGVTYIWYFDLILNGEFDLMDIKLSENTITNGVDGGQGESIGTSTYEYNFQGAGSSYFNSSGFTLKGFQLNDGALYLSRDSGEVTFPPFGSDNDLILMQFNYGSTSDYHIKIIAVYESEEEVEIGNIQLDGNPNFDRRDYETYSHYEYVEYNLESIDFENLVAIKIKGAKNSNKTTATNLFIDQVRIVTKI